MLTIYTNSIRNSVPLTSCRPRRTPVLGPLHTQTQRHGVLAMMIRPYKPRDSARSALLTLQYVTDAPGLAVLILSYLSVFDKIR